MSALTGAARLGLALAAAKTVTSASRISGRGGGTASPGLAAITIDPGFVSKITRDLPRGVVIVAGTNGKTTTSRLLSDMLDQAGLRVLHNRSGSNLVRGVASAIAERATLRGRVQADIAVFESDEAAFPELVRMTNPRVVLLNNLFRDQLDRYGELNTIASKWEPVLRQLDESSTIVLNGDDPRLVGIAENSPAARLTFGMEPGRHALSSLPHAADSATCSRCGRELEYRVLSVSHLGDWHCAGCGWRRPDLDVEARDIELHGVDSLSLSARIGPQPALPIEIGIPGLYNAYNVVAAVATAHALEVPPQVMASACAAFSAPFGRIEHFAIEGRDITLALVKNPVGFNEMLRMLSSGPSGLEIPALIAINDLDADGRDVSWHWDVDFEMLGPGAATLSTTGLRGADMANRPKYAGVDSQRLRPLSTDLRTGLFDFVRGIPEQGSGCVMATYTAMLELRQVLVDEGLAQSFWQQ